MKAAALLLVLVSGCTFLIVRPNPPPPQTGECVEPPLPAVHLVYALRLSRRLVSLAPALETIDTRIRAAITSRRAMVTHSLITPLVRERDVPEPFYFASCEAPPPIDPASAILYHAAELEDRDDGPCELESLATVGKRFGALIPSYPAGLLQGAPQPLEKVFFGKAPAYTLVVLIDPDERKHDYSQCTINGEALGSHFASGRWLDAAYEGDRAKVFFLSIATLESLEGAAAFRQECAEMPGFEPQYLDALSPSKRSFFTDFSAAVGENAKSVEFCAALADDGTDKIDAVIQAIHKQTGLSVL